MTPYQRCHAARCCPLGLALLAAGIPTEGKPRPSHAYQELRSIDRLPSGLFIGHAFDDIAAAWDTGRRKYAAEYAAKLGLI